MARWWLLPWLALPLVAPLSAQEGARATLQGTLSPGDSARRSIAAPATHRWEVVVPRGRYLVVELLQSGIDVSLQVLAPSGLERADIDKTDVPDTETATWIADVAGRWTVVVTPLGEPGDSGSYAIALRVARAATAADRLTVQADSLNMQALRFEDDDRPAEAEQLNRRSLALYETVYGADAVELLMPLDDLARSIEQQGRPGDAEPFYRRYYDILKQSRGPANPDVGYAAMRLGVLAINAARYADARTWYEDALSSFTASTGLWDRDAAAAFSELGRVEARLARYEPAETYYRRALAIYDSILPPTDPVRARTLNNIAVLYVEQARYQDASVLYQQVIGLNLAAHGPDDLQVAIGQYNLAGLMLRWARLEEAEPLYRRSLATHLAVLGPDHRDVGKVYLGLAGVFEQESDFAEAEQLYRRALAIFSAALPPGHPDIAAALIGLGHVYQRQGSLAEAEASYRTAISDLETSLGPQHPHVAQALGDLSSVYIQAGDHARADSLTARVQAIDEANFGPDHPQVAWALRTRAQSDDDQGRYEEAIPRWSRALQIFQSSLGADHPEVAFTLIGLAYSQWMAGRIPTDSALVLLDHAVGMYDATPDNSGRIVAYVVRAELRQRHGDSRGAIADLDAALRAIDDERARIGGDEETRATFFSSFSELYARMVAWQLEAGDTTAAFAFAERGRARVLLDQLAAGRVDIRSSIPADIRAELEQREGDAESRLAELQQRITLMRSRVDLTDGERLRRVNVLEDSLRLADAEYQRVYADIKNASPLWRDQVTSGGQPSALPEIQRTVVPRDGLMLSYLVGTDASVVFVVPPSGRGVEAMTLDVPADVAATLGVQPGPLTAAMLQAVLAGDSTAGTDGGLFYDLSTASRGSTVVGRRPPRAPEARLHALWQVLLPSAVWQQVGGATEVVIIPDGPLHYLPFEALVVDTVRTADGVKYWLDDGPPIRYAGSATALVNITRRPAARVVRAATGPMILSLSDPVFDPAALAGRPQTTEAAATRDGYLRGGGSLARLPGTAQETESVRNTLGAGAPSRLEVLSGTRATEANLRASVGGVRYLHLATHGLVDQQRGSLFASLALTPPPGETSDHANDGFWQLHEIYDARLPELELAVLSACQSNIGLNIAGEGVFALSRGFTAAGARRVVATQWSVDDASTAVLVGEFFQRVLTEDSQGRRVRYAVALRDAQRVVRSQARWRDPFYWAPFILTGKE